MSPFTKGAGSWIKATALTSLAVLSITDVIVSTSHAHLTTYSPITQPSAERPFSYSADEDRAYWSHEFGRELTGAEHLEIQANLVRFVKLLTEHARRTNRASTDQRPQ